VKVIMGDNPFFGVNHRAGSKPLEDEATRFAAAANVLNSASRCGVHSLMLSTHPGYDRLLRMISLALAGSGQPLELALVVPYPHSLNKVVAEQGYAGLARMLGFTSAVKSVFEVLSALRSGRQTSLITAFRSLIGLELPHCAHEGIRVSHVCLHNVATDILLAANRIDILRGFKQACEQQGVSPVFITQNPIALLSSGLSGPYVACFTFNPVGYMVNPSFEQVTRFLLDFDDTAVELWAMQVLASGVTGPDSLVKCAAFRKFDGILYATTNPARVPDFVSTIESHSERA
jgi:hypothetical protein